MSAARPGAVTFTLDLEWLGPSQVDRVAANTERIVEQMGAAGVRGTVFVVGELAERQPSLVSLVSAAGHEVALHGWTHVPLTELTRDSVVDGLTRGKALLESITGRAVAGFRAPIYSLVPSTRWVTDELAALGFRYSSSVLPARSPLFGDPTCPARPFRWPSGVIELPAPVVRLGTIGLPVMGGTYLRLLPSVGVSLAQRWLLDGQLLWTYVHPYDVDVDEPFWVDQHAGRWGSHLLWVGRRRMSSKLSRLVGEGRAGAPLVERLAELTI